MEARIESLLTNLRGIQERIDPKDGIVIDLAILELCRVHSDHKIAEQIILPEPRESE